MLTNIRVEIKPSQETVDRRSGTSSKTGKEYSIIEQRAYVHLGADYPQQIKINLEEGQPPYRAGMYQLSLDSLDVGSFDRLQVRRVKLIPVEK